MHKKLYVIQTTVAAYRVPLFKQIRQVLGDKLAVFCGSRFFDPTIAKDPSFHPDKALTNYFLLSGKILWQKGLVGESFSKGTMILSLNPRVLSNWVVLLLRRLGGKRTLVWGHAWPKAGPQASSDKLRHLMRLIAHEIIVYTKQQKIELQQKMPNKKIHVAPNALYHASEMKPLCTQQPRDIIYVGRMVPNKKVMLLYEAFKNIEKHLPVTSRLILIGDGPEQNLIKRNIDKDKLKHKVILPGAVTDINKLYNYYKSALVSVSPGRVGLGLTQSLGFGVPMIIADDELHGPEIEAAGQYKSWFFTADDMESLADCLLERFRESDTILKRREELSRYCKENYSLEAMAATFINLVENTERA